MTEVEMKSEARLIAIEHILTNALATIYLLTGATDAQIKTAHEASRAKLQADTLPGADPAQADMWMSEIEEAVTALQSAAYEQWKAKMEQASHSLPAVRNP